MGEQELLERIRLLEEKIQAQGKLLENIEMILVNYKKLGDF